MRSDALTPNDGLRASAWDVVIASETRFLYDQIGGAYPTTRRPDPRIAHQLRLALGDAQTLVNVGGGTGSYEPPNLQVVAVEPSLGMIRQRPIDAPPVVRGIAEALPFRNRSFDAGLAVLSLHHWTDWRAGLGELRRVVRQRIVVLTWEPAAARNGEEDAFWLHEYLPALAAFDTQRFPTMSQLADELGHMRVEVVAIPNDCQDGFLGAFWGRPEAYLDPVVRAGMSTFQQILDRHALTSGLERLATDLSSGRWDERFGMLRTRTYADLGHRIVIAEGA
jgi:SAM-dependent methyltransferase